MDFSEVMKEWRRMCDFYDNKYHNEDVCQHCDIFKSFPYDCDAIYSDFGANVDWQVVQDIIERWVQNNPPIPKSVAEKLGIKPE